MRIMQSSHSARTQQEYGKEQKLKIADYENYIEKWAHEIKKPLSLMTLLLDNRKGEMSPLVHTRMLYVRDYARQSVEQILYFSRLGAVHKDFSELRMCFSNFRRKCPVVKSSVSPLPAV